MTCECRIELCLIDATECGGGFHTSVNGRLIHFKRCFNCKQAEEECERLRVEKTAAIVSACHDVALSEAASLKKEVETLRNALKLSLRIPRPWMDGNITFEEWDAACEAVSSALRSKAAIEGPCVSTLIAENERLRAGIRGMRDAAHISCHSADSHCLDCRRLTALLGEEGK